MKTLIDFITESNKIEGITGLSLEDHRAHEVFLSTHLSVETLQAFVLTVASQPLRELRGQDVRVGQHIAPAGGSLIRPALEKILDLVDRHEQHCAYLTLHPFMDGNGRSARALWLKRRGNIPAIGFLQSFYYETLQAAEGRKKTTK